MKLRLLAASVTFSLFAMLSPARAQKADLPGLEGIWYSCANHEENFDLIPEKHQVLFDKEGKFHSGKYHVEGNQITFAGRTFIMTDGELDEGATHWVNGSLLLGTRCPGAASQSKVALTTNGAATPQQPAQPVPAEQPAQTAQGRPVPAGQGQNSAADTFSLARDADIPGYDYGRFIRKPATSERDRSLTVLDLATLQQRAEGGDAVAQVELAARYGTGQDISQDFAQAAVWYSKAADQGNAVAQNNLGYLYAKGKGVPWDNAVALKWFRIAADHGNTSAQNNLAYMYLKAMGIPQDYAQAMTWYGKAADQGDSDAQVTLGRMYHGGFGVEDFKRALEWFQRATDQQDPNGEMGLAMLYDLGHGVRGNSKKGFMLVQKAADSGYGPAQSMLAGRYEFGVGTRKDYAQALAWYRKAADQNYLPAVMKMGDIYRDGEGVPKDDAQAASWYNRAAAEYLRFAERGSLYAQSQLADMYRDGHGVRQDSKQAAVWYARAADQGDATAKTELRKEQAALGDAAAQVELARMYRSGAGVPQDYQQAANWLEKAAAQGNEDAKTDLVALNQEIVKRQAIQAQEQAKNKESDRGKWIAVAGWAGAALANAQGANAATVLKAGLATAAVAAKVTSNNGGQDQTTTALTSLAQATNGQATNPIQQTANEQSAAIFRAGAQAAAQRGQTQQAAQALQMANVYDRAAAQQQQASTAEVASPSPSTSVQANPGAGPASNSAAGLPLGTKIDPSNGQPIAGTCERMDRFVKYSSTVNADDALLMSIQNTSSSDLFVWMKYKRSSWPAYTESLAGSPEWGPLRSGASGQVDVCFLIGGKHEKGDCSRPDDIVVVAVKASDLHTVPPDGYERACDAEFNNVKWPQ